MERFLFFNAVETAPGVFDREYVESDFADYFGSVLSTGLLHTDKVPGMSVSIESGTLKTIVTPGKAIVKGHLYENTLPLTLTHNIPEASMDRIDRIVLRLDLRNQSRFIKLFVLEGVPAASPVAPELQRDNFIHELSLAQVRVRANTSSLNPLDLVDERLKEDLCGLVYSMLSIPTSQFQAQWDLFFANKSTEVTGAADVYMQALLAAESQLQASLVGFNAEWDAWFANQQTVGFVLQSEKGMPNGFAGLDENGEVPIGQLPAMDYIPLSEKSGFKAFTTPGTFSWICPEGISEIYITAVGAGGGGSAQNGGQSVGKIAYGAAGGITSFSNILSVNGGGGGGITSTRGVNGGSLAFYDPWQTDKNMYGAWSPYGANSSISGANGDGFGSGGNSGYGRASNGNFYNGSGGGAGETIAMKKLNVIPGQTYDIRIGMGGKGGVNTTTNASTHEIVAAGDGAGGLLIIQY